MNPYLTTSVLFLLLAGLAALDSALTSFQLVPWFNGLRWLRVHLITLGALGEALFGVLPLLAAKRAGLPPPDQRWEIWLALTGGLLILLVGIPLMNEVLVVTGGTLIFIAALLLVNLLRRLSPTGGARQNQAASGRRFYLSGLTYLLLGIFLGSGLWFGWGQALGMANPLEVHIHTNIWGFMSLAFAGLIVDLYPRWTGYALAWPGAVRSIFWLMTLGALGAVLGPWLAINPLTAVGIVLHQVATVWLVVSMVRPLRGTAAAKNPGIWHVISAYAWQLAIVLATPLIILLGPSLLGAVEQTAPQVLIYGWMLPFGFGVIPYLLRRGLSHSEQARLGGSWFSLAAVHLGGIFLAASILFSERSGSLHGTAYLWWFAAVLPITRQLWQIVNHRLDQPVGADHHDLQNESLL